MDVDILIEDSAWEAVGLENLATRAIMATLAYLKIDAQLSELSVLGCNDARIAALNADFRDKPTATNVLSWPSQDLAPQHDGQTPQTPKPDPDGTVPLGDIAIAYETCAREAEGQRKSLTDHVTHLIIHGTLHLLGYDHIRDLDATLMEAIETEILGKMGIDDPYR